MRWPLTSNTRSSITRTGALSAVAVVALGFGALACGDEDPVVEILTGIPDMAQLSGTWTFTLTNTVNGCGEIVAPFTLSATLGMNPTTATDLDVQFPAPALPITGPYAPSTGAFTGTTSGFDVGNGQTSTESWTASFVFVDGNPEAAGLSNVALTDAEQTLLCEGTFTVVGSRTGS